MMMIVIITIIIIIIKNLTTDVHSLTPDLLPGTYSRQLTITGRVYQ